MTAHIKRLWTTPQGLRVEYFETEDAKMPQDRDTHFLGFASLLYEEVENSLLNIAEFSFVPDAISEEIKQLFAQRAYDFLVSSHYHTAMLATWEESMERVALVPDLTEWPKLPESSTE